MSKIRVMLMPSPPGSGSIGSATKMLGVAKALEQRGAAVSFVIGGKLGEFFALRGYKVYSYPVPKIAGTDVDINNVIDFLEWTGLCNEEFIHEAVFCELQAIEDFKPTIIFAEARPSAAISANTAGIPLATIASWSCSPDNPLNASQTGRLVQGFNKELTRQGLRKIENIAELFFKRSDRKLAPTLPVLEPEIVNEKNIKFTGYILDDKKDESFKMDWYEEMDKENLIFIYLSVGALQPKFYIETIVNTFRNSKYHVICGCGFHFALDYLPEQLPNIKFLNYIPLRNIIEDTRLVLFHGGQDTMLTTLLYGVPSVTFPGKHFERVYNAEKIDTLKLSQKHKIWAFRPQKLKSIINTMETGAYKERCINFKKEFLNYKGTNTCADILYNSN